MGKYSDYLIGKNNPLSISYYGEKFDTKGYECNKTFFEKTFNIRISCETYSSVVNGEGSEKEKIDSLISSSLQSLLIFAEVSEKKPIYIRLGEEKVKFIKAYFEYRNKVLSRPSSIDVVLQSDKNDLLFIESKFFEPYYESSVTPKAVIGISYFYKNYGSTYWDTLYLRDKTELDSLGIEYPDDYGANEKPNTKKYAIHSIDKKTGLVYSEGIKQCLAHIIGISNFRNPDKKCNNELKNFKARSLNFITIVNDLPDFSKSDVPVNEKVDNYKKHINKTISTLRNKDKVREFVNLFETISYQDLYKENEEYFKGKEAVVEFYKLNK